MTGRTTGWLLVTVAAVVPLTAAEPANPVDEARTKARTLYMQFAQVPQGERSTGLKESAAKLQELPVQRAQTQPQSRPAPTSTTQPSNRPAGPGPQAQPAQAEMDAAVLKKLTGQRVPDVSVLVSMADGLYASGRLRTAEAVYEAAAGGQTDTETAAWIVYQLANCRRKANPDEALKLYDKLRAEPTECPWRDAAEASRRVLEWTTTDKLQALVESASRVETEEPKIARPQAAAKPPAAESLTPTGKE